MGKPKFAKASVGKPKFVKALVGKLLGIANSLSPRPPVLRSLSGGGQGSGEVPKEIPRQARDDTFGLPTETSAKVNAEGSPWNHIKAQLISSDDDLRHNL